MRALRTRSYLLFVLPGLHLALCLAIAAGLLSTGAPTHAGGWNWFPLFLLDFPASILLMRVALGLNHDAVVFTIGGTLWWLLISLIFGWIISGIASLFRRKPAKSRATASRIE
jgi:hypothetical protein